MKNRILLSFLSIFLILALMDCGMISPGIPEWMKAEELIWQYWIVIINHQYKLAEYYYVLMEFGITRLINNISILFLRVRF